jgi:mannose-6-phosphate isomerase-like protein (cupin superfamily)
MASRAALSTRRTHIPVRLREPILRNARSEVSLLVAGENLSITHARYAAGERVASPHVHAEHTDAFYVLEGELTFEIGPERETVNVGVGGFVAAPPGVAHSFRTADDRPARWLTIHAQDGGFAEFMRGIRDGIPIDWDIEAIPNDGGLPRNRAVVRRSAR